MSELLVISNIVADIAYNLRTMSRLTHRELPDIYRGLIAATARGAYDMPDIIITDPILQRIVDCVKRLTDVLMHLTNRYLTGIYLCDMLRMALRKIREYKKSPFIIVCDGLGLSDASFLLHIFGGQVFCGINPGGMTKTYEFIVRKCPEVKAYFPHTEEISLSMVAKALAKALRCHNWAVYDKIDIAVMSNIRLKDINALASYLYQPLSLLVNEVDRLLKEGYAILLTADHGYDMNVTPEGIELKHRWRADRPSLSVLAPMLVMGGAKGAEVK